MKQTCERLQYPKAVACGAIFNTAGDGILLSLRPSHWYSPIAGMWEFPGGKIEVGEQPAETVRREVYEELGLHVDVNRDPWMAWANSIDDKGAVILLYACRLISLAQPNPEPLESEGVRMYYPETSFAPEWGEFAPHTLEAIARFRYAGLGDPAFRRWTSELVGR